MEIVIDVWMLAKSALELCADRFACQLDSHPTTGFDLICIQCLGRCGSTDFADDAIEVLITLWDSYKTADLAYSISVSVNDREA